MKHALDPKRHLPIFPRSGVIRDVRAIVEYLYYDEHKSYEEATTNERRNHIFHVVRRLQAWAGSPKE